MHSATAFFVHSYIDENSRELLDKGSTVSREYNGVTKIQLVRFRESDASHRETGSPFLNFPVNCVTSRCVGQIKETARE